MRGVFNHFFACIFTTFGVVIVFINFFGWTGALNGFQGLTMWMDEGVPTLVVNDAWNNGYFGFDSLINLIKYLSKGYDIGTINGQHISFAWCLNQLTNAASLNIPALIKSFSYFVNTLNDMKTSGITDSIKILVSIGDILKNFGLAIITPLNVLFWAFICSMYGLFLVFRTIGVVLAAMSGMLNSKWSVTPLTPPLTTIRQMCFAPLRTSWGYKGVSIIHAINLINAIK